MALSRPVVRRDFCWTLSLHTRFFAPERTRDERWREESRAQEAEVRGREVEAVPLLLLISVPLVPSSLAHLFRKLRSKGSTLLFFFSSSFVAV